MSTSRKIIKLFSILGIIGGLTTIVLGVLLALDIWNFGPSMLVGYPISTLELSAVMVGIIAVVEGIVMLICGWVGVKGANRPSKIGPYIVLTAIILIYYIVCLVLSLVTKSGELTTIVVQTVWNLIALILGFNVKKEAQR